jgi:thymidylate synthase (FAD)
MKNIKVTSLNKSHDNPEEFIANIVNLTFSKRLNSSSNPEEMILNSEAAKINTLKNVIEMNHTGMLEHINCTYLIQGASRSFLAQITRHRLFSFVSASQQYIDWSDFADFVIPVELENKEPEVIKQYLEANKKALEEYKKLIDDGIHHEVARQVLPNSMRNNLIVTGNLRQWLNFMNLRLCNRNTSEIQYVAMLIKEDLEKYVPNIAKYMGPDCMVKGHCTQKHLFCGEYYTDEKCHAKYKVLKKDER